MSNKFLLLSAFVLIPAVVGCAVGPDYKKPETWSPAKWAETHKGLQGQVNSQTTMGKIDSNWWECFHDPILSELERRVVAANLDVQMATQNLIASRAQLKITGADRFPNLSASGSYSRMQNSSRMVRHAIKRVENRKPVLGEMVKPSEIDIPTFDSWSDNLNTSWELDIWGRVRREYEAARASWQLSAEDRRSVLIMQLAEVAKDYVALRGLQAELDIVQKNVKIAQDSLTLAKQRYQGGLVTELDVHSAEAQLEQTQSNIPQLQENIIEYMNALSLLVGEPPRSLEQLLSASKTIPPTPPTVPVGLPSELLQRRPDIRKAEAQLHAATAQVGAAIGDFYPKVTVDARMGFQSLSFKDLGFWGSRAWSVGPTLSLPIFEGGKLRGQLTLRKAQQKEAALSYRKTVLQAWQEVDNALAAYQAEQLHQERLQETVKANQKSLMLAQEQYREGLQNFINVLDAERRLLESQRALIESTSQISENLVQLYKAMGGGWETVFPEKVNEKK